MQTITFTSAKFKNGMFCPSYILLRANCVGPSEAAHDEPPHLDQRRLQIQFFMSCALNSNTHHIAQIGSLSHEGCLFQIYVIHINAHAMLALEKHVYI